jgi:hypothetical protein
VAVVAVGCLRTKDEAVSLANALFFCSETDQGVTARLRMELANIILGLRTVSTDSEVMAAYSFAGELLALDKWQPLEI